jgi:hypothetical protein
MTVTSRGRVPPSYPEVDAGVQIQPIAANNEHHLGPVLAEYLRHYNTAMPRRAIGQLTSDQAGACPPGKHV